MAFWRRLMQGQLRKKVMSLRNYILMIRIFLHNFPFGVDNIKLDIGFEDNERKIIQDGHVALMYISKNQELIYRAYNPDTEEYYPLFRESYVEALKLVMGQ